MLGLVKCQYGYVRMDVINAEEINFYKVTGLELAWKVQL